MFVQASTPSLFLCSKTVRSTRLFFLKSVVTPSSSANFNYPPSFLFAERRKGKSTDEIEGRKRYISTNILFDREGRHCSADSESVSLRQTCEHWQVQSVSDTHTGRPTRISFPCLGNATDKKNHHHHWRSIYRRPIAYLLCLAAWPFGCPPARQCPSVPGSLPPSIRWRRLGRRRPSFCC